MSERLVQLRKLLADDPQDADVHYMIAQELALAGDVTGAVAAYDACLAIDGHYHYARYHMAKVLDTAGRTVEAIDVLRTAIPIAKAAHDSKAVNELIALLDELT